MSIVVLVQTAERSAARDAEDWPGGPILGYTNDVDDPPTNLCLDTGGVVGRKHAHATVRVLPPRTRQVDPFVSLDGVAAAQVLQDVHFDRHMNHLSSRSIVLPFLKASRM
ncbi:hypothetical protein [Frigoribacterium sp. CFBP 13707]|uniref:hypothetical protein n=1 Tax=Frigoribacterium sp. CFBP 13707 TaxID=2775313 RepID=UPI00177F9D3D|nr:hypothetical protein [Frigoribacterium sp. CFBP 13707]MBD8729502.1 hypothetical protein [Frigoribacterium sp. CFBP 13707]